MHGRVTYVMYFGLYQPAKHALVCLQVGCVMSFTASPPDAHLLHRDSLLSVLSSLCLG